MKGSDNPNPSILLEELGASPASPAADYRRLYFLEDGILYQKDSGGTVAPVGGTPTEILDIPTTETDDTLVLAPDGAGGVEFRAEAGGSGGWTDALVERESGSDASDDEFDDGSFSGWTSVETAAHGTTATEKGDTLSIIHDTTADGGEVFHARLKSIGAHTAPTTITAGVRLMHTGNGYPFVGVAFTDGTTFGAGKQVHGSISSRGGSGGAPIWARLGRHTNFSTSSATTDFDVYGWYVGIHVRLKWEAANTWGMQVSPDGVSWWTTATGISYTMTPTHFGLWFGTYGNNTGSMVVSWDYFRVS